MKSNYSTKLGLIGAGAWGSNYIKTIEKIDGIELIGISTKSGIIKNDFLDRKNLKFITIGESLSQKKILMELLLPLLQIHILK